MEGSPGLGPRRTFSLGSQGPKSESCFRQQLAANLCQLHDSGINQIFCSSDKPKGNAAAERLVRTIKEELLWLNEFTFFEQAYEALEAWIANDYNRLYVHSALG